MSRLHKQLGVGKGVALLATSLMGTGIFVVPAIAASIAGAWSLLAWGVLIALVMPVAFTFALLGKRFPHAGGSAHIVGRALGPRFEKLTAFLFLAVLPVGLPAALVMATGFWHSVMDLTHFAELSIQLATLALILMLGLGGTKLSGSIQGGIALLIVALVAVLWWQGDIQLADISLSRAEEGNASSIVPALSVMFWCFVGIEAFTHMGEEFENPERDFPIALILGVLLAGLVYWGCSVAILKFGVYGSEQENTTAIPRLLALMFGPTGQWLAAIIGYLACFASMNVYIQGFSRLLWSMAEEGSLKRIGLGFLGKLNDRKVPARALWVVSGVCVLSILTLELTGLPLESMIRFANGNFIVVYLLSMLAGVLILKGWQKWLAILSSLLCAAVLIALGADSLYVVALTLLFFIVGLVMRANRKPPQSIEL
ncbi:L-methionine/branched-chain amino acid transporter [Endozoicomonas sp. OPT23]|uniref:L-methionine/branched-chain amino acid transporter n=1 Tax=Endozoicomonas sp. OPT23 TaxID=2072845 RepID=UPI00129A5772|nr:L-methionine/branched-chain amino acid transporter [Endozoicomonas sp. OPT23]MRI35102.1 L-methionine/branched-chain amino acid transporter [Endozoicomonas sp. OPT23]